MDFQIDTIDFEETSFSALVITRWLDFGEGQNAIDPKWCCHFLWGYKGNERHVSGQIKWEFERKSEVSYEEG